jgi:hypothetical protein
VAKLADAGDLKSPAARAASRFDSGRPYLTGFRWHRWHSAIWNATLVWQTPQESPAEIWIIEVFFVPLFVLG